MKQPMSLFSRNLRFLRRLRELNQDEIARLFNKRANTIGNWENEKSEPNLSELVSLGEYFNISLHELLHTDLELEKMSPGATKYGSGKKKSVEYEMQEASGNIVKDEGGISLESISRDLKIVHEKLDKITSILNSAGIRHSIDKSNH